MSRVSRLGGRLRPQTETVVVAVSPTGLASAAALSEPGASADLSVGRVIYADEAPPCSLPAHRRLCLVHQGLHQLGSGEFAVEGGGLAVEQELIVGVVLGRLA